MAPTSTELLQNVLEELSYIKKDLPNGQFKILMETVKDMKEDISELKYTLLNPEDGVIVRTNKSLELSRYFEKEIEKLEFKINILDEVVKWKTAVNKALWILFTALVAIIVQILSMYNAS